MFTDTHFHLMSIKNRGIDINSMLLQMAQQKFPFLLDIGTEVNDFLCRYKEFSQVLLDIASWGNTYHDYLRKITHFSCGLWPSTESINNRHEYIKIIEKTILENSSTIIALGECGIDRHYNLDNIPQEIELFQLQLELAKKLNLSVIVHSREDFESTYESIKEVDYNKGVIHCYSYGIEEAKKFLDRGWYISFSGSCTYAKKTKMEQMQDLIRYIPQDMLLLETDAPYLAPVPLRGQTNTPLLIEHIYKFVSEILNIPIEILCDTIYKNAIKCYNL